MSRFAGTLSEASRRLDLPRPVRSRVVLELAADLEDLFEHFVSEGMSEDEAEARALERVELSDQAVARLLQVHASAASRLVNRVSERTRALWERVLLLVVGLFVVAVLGREMLTASIFSGASRFLWPVAAASLVGILLVLWKIYALFSERGRDLRRLRSGLPTLLALAALTVLLALLGALVEMHQAALSVGSTATSLAAESIYCMARIAPMIAFSLVAAVVMAVAWFALSSRVARVEEAEASLLLDERGA